jgi:hypothetical protein
LLSAPSGGMTKLEFQMTKVSRLSHSPSEFRDFLGPLAPATKNSQNLFPEGPTGHLQVGELILH